MTRFSILFVLTLLVTISHGQHDRTRNFPKKVHPFTNLTSKEKVWIFVMAGQSNMAGRGLVEPEDTIPHSRILTINNQNQTIVAKEPLHFYEPNLTGLDCGLSFAKKLLTSIDTSVTILMLPTAVGGSSTFQWVGDSLHRGVKLFTNFKNRVDAVRQYGTFKGILWHQGEADSETSLIAGYDERIGKLFSMFRNHIGNEALPIFIGELGSFSENQANWNAINKAIHAYVKSDKYSFIIDTQDLVSKEDKVHFNSAAQRLMGQRMASSFLEKVEGKKIR